MLCLLSALSLSLQLTQNANSSFKEQVVQMRLPSNDVHGLWWQTQGIEPRTFRMGIAAA